MVAKLPAGGGDAVEPNKSAILQFISPLMRICACERSRHLTERLLRCCVHETQAPPFFFCFFVLMLSGTRRSTWYAANTAGCSAEMKDCNQTINQKSLRSNPPPLSDVFLVFWGFFFVFLFLADVTMQRDMFDTSEKEKLDILFGTADEWIMHFYSMLEHFV